MLITVIFRGKRMQLTFSSNERVSSIRKKLIKKLQIDSMVTPKTVDATTFEMYFRNNRLMDSLSLHDIGIKSGESIVCKHTEKPKVYLRVQVPFLAGVLKLTEEFDINANSIEKLRSDLQDRLGLPVSCFRVTDDRSRPLFDCHTLGYYGIVEGDRLNVLIHEGLTDFLNAAIQGDINGTFASTVSISQNLTMYKFQLRTALFIAAHMNHAQLAVQLMLRGARCDEPVGEYPSRQWCQASSHPDTNKTPTHQAAQRGSFACLQLFLRKSPGCIIQCDGYGLTPANLARRHRKRKCWKLLVASQFQMQKIGGFSLSLYKKIQSWCNRAKDRVQYYKHETNGQYLLGSQVSQNATHVGNSIFIDGYKLNCEALNTVNIRSIAADHGARSSQALESGSKPLLSDGLPPLENDSNQEHSNLLTVAGHSPRPSHRKNASRISQATFTSVGKFPKPAVVGQYGTMVNDHRFRLPPLHSSDTDTEGMIVTATGFSTKELAVRSLNTSRSLHERSWSKSLEMALRCSTTAIQAKRK